MSYWTLQIIYHDKEKYPWYGVHEIFYNDDGSIYAYTEDAMDVTGETVEELKEYAQMIVNDINKAPILIQSEIVCTADKEEIDLSNIDTFKILDDLLGELNEDGQ